MLDYVKWIPSPSAVKSFVNSALKCESLRLIVFVAFKNIAWKLR